MTIQEVKNNFVQNLAENAYINMCSVEEMNIAIKALEKQIPKNPLKQKFGFCDLVGFFDFRLVCPECEQPIARYFNKKEYKPRYCHNCGQALDWSVLKE